jgi:predicted Zn-dependent protease
MIAGGGRRISGRGLAATLSLAIGLAGCAAVDQALEIAKPMTGMGDAVGQVQQGLRAGSRVVRAAAPVTPEQEHFIGRSVAAEIVAKPSMRVSSDAKLGDYVSDVGQAIVLSSPSVGETFQGYRFVLVDSATVNAIATPGGYVFVTKGLVAAATDEDELAAALAHEIAHVQLHHGLTAIRESNLAEAANIVGTEMTRGSQSKLTGLFGSSVQEVVTEVVTKGFSREQEAEADRLAVQLLAETGYSPKALATLLRRVNFDGGGFTSDHPSGADRAAAAESAAASLPPARGVDVRAARFAQATGGR